MQTQSAIGKVLQSDFSFCELDNFLRNLSKYQVFF